VGENVSESTKKLHKNGEKPFNKGLNTTRFNLVLMKKNITLEADFPSVKGRWLTVEDQIISYFPNVPCRTSKHFHKTRSSEGLPGSYKVFRKRPGEIPMDV
jgi:hypothetical protein